MKSRNNAWLLLPVVVFAILFSSCKQEYPFYEGEGKYPVYLSFDSLGNIYNLPPQPVTNSGTIVLKDSFLYMSEAGKGIHVFNVADTSNPVQLTFIQIPAHNSFTISGNVIYADNGTNLVAIDVSDIFNIVLLSTNKNVFKQILFPQFYDGIFECADETKGVVIDWRDTYLTKAKCRIFN